MKYLLPLVFVCSGCSMLGKPADPANPEGPTLGDEISTGVTTVAAATGNPLILAAAGVVSVLLAGGALKKKPKPPTP